MGKRKDKQTPIAGYINNLPSGAQNRKKMEREIKFRVWDNVDYMSNPFTLQDLQLKKIEFLSVCPVMQFTGLKDNNGNEIYEGDIMGEGIVIWQEQTASFVLEADTWVHTMRYASQNYEVRGNIYENPLSQ